LALGYNLSPKSIGAEKWVNAIRFSFTGQNLFLSTKYDGYDPEVNIDNSISGVSSYGIDYLSYPKAKTFIFGLNITF
jgi:iron complex outermembrane receptor protein